MDESQMLAESAHLWTALCISLWITPHLDGVGRSTAPGAAIGAALPSPCRQKYVSNLLKYNDYM